MYGKVQTRFAYPTGLNKKFSDVRVSDVICSSTEAVAAPTVAPYVYTSFFKQIVQGTGATQRIGRRIVCHSVQIEIQLSTPTVLLETASLVNASDALTANIFDTTINLAVVRNMQTNGLPADITDIYDNLDDNVPLRNMANTMQFQVLKHKQIKFSPQFTTNTVDGAADTQRLNILGMVKNVSMYWKCAELINFSGTTDDIANIVDNNVFLLAWTDNRPAAVAGSYATPISIEANLRTRFTDLQ